MPLKRPQRSILVLGSLAWETVLVPDPDNPDRLRSQSGWVGAPIIRKVIAEALVEKDWKPADPKMDEKVRAEAKNIQRHLAPNDPDPRTARELRAECGEITTVFRSFPKKSIDTKKSGRVLRVQRTYRASGGVSREATAATTGSNLRGMVTYLRQSLNAHNVVDIVVVYDQDPLFREAFNQAVLRKRPFKKKPLLILALAGEIREESVKDICKHISTPRDTVVLLTAVELRKCGLNIVEYGSIEQTVRELAAYVGKSPIKTILDLCQHLIILFEETGAIYIRREADSALNGSIHFCPNFDRIAQMDHNTYGWAPGRMAIALAAVVRQINTEASKLSSCNLAGSIRLALAAYNLHFSEGFDRDRPFQTMQMALSCRRRFELRSFLEDKDNKKEGREFILSSLAFPMNNTIKTWSRLDAVVPVDILDKQLVTCLHKIVKSGEQDAFRNVSDSGIGKDGHSVRVWFPESTITCPFLEVGRIRTFDSEEITGFVELAKLIRKYLREEAWSTPLSIATFGPPGSGKNFAVKELLKSINPASREMPALNYNLAQFNSVALLTEAFHQVQDRALSSDQVPLVNFDEFDCYFETRLGWLKYFLAPMQDGTFRGQSADYRVGRAIFLFAGGTSSSFQGFKDKAKQMSKKRAGVIPDAKLTDFVSRLHGFLNVLSINPPDRKSEKREPKNRVIQRKIRRAVILRSLLMEHAKPIFSHSADSEVANIDEHVIDAFLNVSRYEHGVRSMEAIVRMSRWIGGHFMAASLPSQLQLDMHARQFWH